MNLREGAEPFTMADFMGTGDRDKRSMQRVQRAMEVNRENKKLLSITKRKPNEKEPEWLPDWARES